MFHRSAGLFLLLTGACLTASAADDFVPGRLLVRYRAGVEPALLNRTLRLNGAVERRRIEGIFSILEVPQAASEAIRESLLRTGLFEVVERDYYAHTAQIPVAVPNDPSYISQWHLPQIHGPQAWGITTGAASVTVAVIDTGVYAQHPDLSAKILPGWNFVTGTDDTSDNLGHGTAVAGTISPASNNSLGIAGVSWASRILPLVVVDKNDFAPYSDIAQAIQYAADHNVRVINISIGGASPSATLDTAVEYAWARGAILFASAMNNGTSSPNYPAACTHVVAVSATDNHDHLAGFSNYGYWIALSAPGTNILSTMSGGGYGYWSGTSFSSPIVAGVAALMLAVNPSLTNAQVVSILEQTADDLGDPGFDPSFGWGRVNAYRAVMAAKPAVKPRRPKSAEPATGHHEH